MNESEFKLGEHVILVFYEVSASSGRVVPHEFFVEGIISDFRNEEGCIVLYLDPQMAKFQKKVVSVRDLIKI